jgi:glutamine amidotransferase
MKVNVLDYGVGNLYSLCCALQKMNAVPKITRSIPKVGDVDALILPGVGGFTSAATRLTPQINQLHKLVEEGIPILGICLGLQLFFERSEEGEGKGLGLIEGRVIKLSSSVKVPQMGWNNLHIIRENDLTLGVDGNSWVYFAHSYCTKPSDRSLIIAETTYGENITAIMSKKNLHGTQFHPEKSGKNGLTLINNFLNLARR